MNPPGSTATRGFLITFEGGEGAGKSTQARLLADRLQAAGRRTVLLREPGGTALGEHLRDLLLRGPRLAPEAELLLFLAARAQLVHDVIQPAIAGGDVVLCDRFSDSTIAYQGYGRGLGIKTIRALNRFATRGLEPDLTFFLDIPPAEGLARKERDEDAFHREDPSFHERVRAGFQEAGASRDRWQVIDASAPIESIAAEVWQIASGRLDLT